MTQIRNTSKRICEHCPEPKPLLTDARFYDKYHSRCIECVKKHNSDYVKRKKSEKEGQPPMERTCKYCPEPKPDLTDSDFYGPVGRRCKTCTLQHIQLKKGLSKDKERTGTSMPSKTVERSPDSNELHDLRPNQGAGESDPRVDTEQNQRIRELEEELQTLKDRHVKDLEEQIRLLNLLTIHERH